MRRDMCAWWVFPLPSTPSFSFPTAVTALGVSKDKGAIRRPERALRVERRSLPACLAEALNEQGTDGGW